MLTPGQPAPDFSGPDLINGGTFTLSDHLGQVVCLALGAYWCSHCGHELDRLQSLWVKYQGHGVQMVFVHVDPDAAAGLTWLTGHGISYPALQDDAATTIFSQYATGTSGVPQCYIIGRDGAVHSNMLGAFPEADIEGRILDALYARQPVDLELVMDVSDSMNFPSTGDSKLEMLKQTCTMITDFLTSHGQPDDRMGLVWFTDNASEYTSLGGEALLPVSSSATALKDQIDAHGTGTCTAMGAGLQTALDRLATSTHKRAAILCTDGMQNIEPKITSVGDHFEILDSGGWLCGAHSATAARPGVNLASYDTVLHTVGIGITATYEPLLQQLADATGGFYQATHDPATDLDLIYFVALCNCLAGGSPAVVHHATGNLPATAVEATESFHLNASARKVSVLVSWPRSAQGSLTFWLYAPDGSLLDLHRELQHHADHCMATVYLPRKVGAKVVPSVGQWRLVIKGEALGESVPYHAMVIAEDRETHLSLDFPRRLYEIGDLLPIRMELTDQKKPLVNLRDIIVEISSPREPLAELLARYKEPRLDPQLGHLKYKLDPLAAKLEALSRDPRWAARLTPLRKVVSMRAGTLRCSIERDGVKLAMPLDKAGLHAFKITVIGDAGARGEVVRTSRVAVQVGAGKVDPGKTVGHVARVATEHLEGTLVTITPRTSTGALLGPGFASSMTATLGRSSAKSKVIDCLDGTYQLELPTAERAKREELTVFLHGNAIWRSAT